MKIKIETLEELLGEVETKDQFKIILPFLKKISELKEIKDYLFMSFEGVLNLRAKK